MAGDNYRIEKGQKLSSAVSARAWNRAQDAADIVFGERQILDSDPALPGHVNRITVRLPKSALNQEMASWPSHIPDAPTGGKLAIGHAISLGQMDDSFNATMCPVEDEQWNGSTSSSELESLPHLQTSAANRFLQRSSIGGPTESFGIVAAVSSNDEYYFVSLIVGGVIVCRCLSFAPGDGLIGPAPVPTNNSARGVWYPYPLMGPAGSSRVLAVGGYTKLTQSQWPRVCEVLVRL